MSLPSEIPQHIRRYLTQGAMNPQDAMCVWCATAAAVQRFDALREGVITANTLGTPLFAIYETLLQTYLFAGFPAGIEGLSVFADTLNRAGIAFVPPAAETFDADRFYERGLPLYQTVYGAVAGKMSAAVGAISPDLYTWMLVEGYGKTLSRAGATSVTRELCIVGVLAALGWQRQLFSHIRGAINVGATPDEARHAAAICEYLAPGRSSDAQRTLGEALKATD